MRPGPVVLATLLVVLVVVQVDARFAASNGEFAGREGVTCTACHAPSNMVPEARMSLDGLPDRWDAGETYRLQVAVTGGPPAAPAGRPQGGFEMEASAGSFAITEAMQGSLRFPQPSVITYTAEGTAMRQWEVDWTAPDHGMEPQPVTFWLAGVSANGNHVVSGDDGESGDASASTVLTARASEDAIQAWQAIPLRPPVVDKIEQREGGWRLQGRHMDDNATHLGILAPDEDLQTVPTSTTWIIETRHHPDDLSIRSEGKGRISPYIGQEPDEARSPVPWLPFAVALLIVAGTRRGLRS